MKENKLIQTLAYADPEFDSFYSEYAYALAAGENFPVELAREVLTLVRQENADLDALLTSQQDSIDMTHRYISPEVVGGTLVAAVFLLRSHIKIQKCKDGKYVFKFEHKPIESDLLKSVLAELQKLITIS